MKSWTGYEGKKDKEIREYGNTYILCIVDGELFYVERIEQLDSIAWDEWCNVCAISLNEAKKNYDKAFLQWRKLWK